MVFVCTLTRDKIEADTTYSLVNMLQQEPQAVFSIAVGTYVHQLREGVAQGVLGIPHPITHLLFVDADMIFPYNALRRLMAHKKPIVGANYHNRMLPDKWTAKIDGKDISSADKTGIQKVDTIGMGLCLIDLAVLRKLPQPRFEMKWNGESFDGEDETFCLRSKLAGFDTFVDHDLSREVMHIAKINLPRLTGHLTKC